ncbi:MAG: PDZ domain-containing protein [Lysobacterales bacterium]|nr:MAG: PDZ domain-containing protein [Xanthomonadales bacterium]
MLEKKLSWIFTAATLAMASQSVAQPANPEGEGAVARELALEQEAAARERAALEREHVRAEAAALRERANVERELALEQAAAERELALEQATAQRDLQRELARAREELARTVAEVARVSAQISRPVLRDVERNLRFMVGGPAVLGLNIEDTDLGVLVNGVTPNGPAATAGVAVGDTIVAINDIELARAAGRSAPSATLLGQVGNVVAGDEVKLRIVRDGDYRDVVVKAGANRLRMPLTIGGDEGSWSPAAWLPFRYSGAWSDIELVSLTPALGEYFGVSEGLLVVRAGRASELGFHDGDVIIDLAGREPQSPEHALRILASFEPGESLQAAIMRQRRREALAIRVPTASSQ